MSFKPTNNFRSPLALLAFAGTAALGLAIDLITKVWSFNVLLISMVQLPDGSYRIESDRYPFIPGWLEFYVTVNQGAVFGIGQGQRWLFLSVSVAAIIFLSWLFAFSGRRFGYHIILGMLLAGVLGNMYDRVMFGYVRDMIHALPRWPNLFPWIFNVADSLLCVGVGLMLLYSFFHREQPRHAGAGARTSEEAKVREG